MATNPDPGRSMSQPKAFKKDMREREEFKMFVEDIKQDVEASSKAYNSGGVPTGYEYEPANAYQFNIHTPSRHGEHEDVELLGKVYHQASGGSETNGTLYSSSILQRFMTPMGNTVLHVAALHGNVEMVDRVLQAAQQPLGLLLSTNTNGDTPLHVAARAGHVSTLRKLLIVSVSGQLGVAGLIASMEKKNNEGNTLLHEAVMRGGSMGSMVFQLLQEAASSASVEATGSRWSPSRPYEFALKDKNNESRSVLCLAVEARLMEVVNQILDYCPQSSVLLSGTSPLVAAIMKRDIDMLTVIVNKRPEWIHLEDMNTRIALHWAAFRGYHEGVVYLLAKCRSCTIKRDLYGLMPIHLAAGAGHVEVVRELLGYCPDPDEMLDKDHSNILHIAAKYGELDVVRYILDNPQLEKMINQKDKSGDTPLHVATSSCHPKIVYALTWDHRVHINAVNHMNKTPLDLALEHYASSSQKSQLRQSLTWIALKSAGANSNPQSSLKIAPNPNDSGDSSADKFKDRVDSLSVISTLVITASVAACLAVPGEADGTANNLNKAMFQLFTFCITISLFTSISATILLIWGKMGMIELLNLATEFALPLIGASLITLSLAFLAGVYTVISKLTWLATTFVVMTAIFTVILCVLYFFLLLPSSSNWKIMRYISYYPFIYMASLTEEQKPRTQPQLGR